jgi:acyl-CoA reductase-like NAD-dependent aldehyde dehydrogenase
MVRNLALSVSLYSGQMCTTPQNVFVPRTGIATDAGYKSFDEVASAIGAAIDALLATPERAAEVLGAIAAETTAARVDAESAKPGVIRAGAPCAHPQFPAARMRSPLVVALDAARGDRYDGEMFGPVVYVIAVDSTSAAFAIATRSAQTRGAITAILHSTSPGVIALAGRAAADGRVSLAINFTGALLVNQSAAFSDYHLTGGNPAGNASLTDAAFVAGRFRIIETREPVVEPA